MDRTHTHRTHRARSQQASRPPAATEAAAAQALRVARAFLDHFGDRFTQTFADELAQDAAFDAWRRRRTLRRTQCWEAFVRTVCRRRRFRALVQHMEVPLESFDADRALKEQLIAEERVPACVRVAGRRIPMSWCTGQLDGVLRRLGSLNACLVRSYYDGFSCSELAHRFNLPESNVKVRLHRCRERIRREFENRVRRTGAEVLGA